MNLRLAPSEALGAGAAAHRTAERRLSGWGRTFVPGYEVRDERLERIARGATLSRGLGASYGDSSLPPVGVLETVGTTLADRILQFDPETGLLRAEAGLSLYALNHLFLARNWFTPVTPGTQFVTLGGMVASDVHGKNHHENLTFGHHVRALRLMVADGRVIECSPKLEPELFYATLGGMGLTGHILEVSFQMERIPSPWILTESRRVNDIDALLDGLKTSAADWPFTVGWIDSLAGSGRGHLYLGRWASPEEAPAELPRPKRRITLPFSLPTGTVNARSVKLFNWVWYWKLWRTTPLQKIEHPETYFYPLDLVRRWNLAYGARGVTQYQCVIPDEAGREPVKALLELLARFQTASFLTVVKDCGLEGKGFLSFPRPGISIALDLPITRSTQETIDALNQVVIASGGRIYLSKDGFTRARDFQQMEPRLSRFLEVRATFDPDNKIRSHQSERLMRGD